MKTFKSVTTEKANKLRNNSVQLVRLQRLSEGTKIALTWDDKLQKELWVYDLRLACPCARCIHEVTGKKLVNPANISSEISLKDMQPVGNYAYRLLFSDDHDSGIYTLELLRKLCEAT